jgi:hypothetical protein
MAPSLPLTSFGRPKARDWSYGNNMRSVMREHPQEGLNALGKGESAGNLRVQRDEPPLNGC